MFPTIQQTCPFLRQYLEGTNPGMPLLPASDHPPNSFPVATFRTVFSATPCPGDQPTPYFELSPLLPPQPGAPRFLRTIPQELPPTAWSPSIRGLLHLPLWASHLPGRWAVSGAGHFFPALADGKPRRRLKMQAQQGSGQFSRRRRSCSKRHGVKPWTTEAAMILAKNLKLTLWDLRAQVCAGAHLPLALPEEPLPAGAGETHQEMATPWGACAGWAGELLLQRFTPQHHQEPPQPDCP